MSAHRRHRHLKDVKNTEIRTLIDQFLTRVRLSANSLFRNGLAAKDLRATLLGSVRVVASAQWRTQNAHFAMGIAVARILYG
jgi:hypothetical protein